MQYWFELKVFNQQPFNKSLFIIFGFHTHSCSGVSQPLDGAIAVESEFQSKQFDSDQRGFLINLVSLHDHKHLLPFTCFCCGNIQYFFCNFKYVLFWGEIQVKCRGGGIFGPKTSRNVAEESQMCNVGDMKEKKSLVQPVNSKDLWMTVYTGQKQNYLLSFKSL